MKQVTFAPRNHQLTNTRTWTPDSQWLVFDVRPSGASFTGETIERVNVNSGAVETIYRATQGAHVGVVTVHPTQERYVFIHGPERPDAQWQYDFHHRRGVVAFQGAVENLDAMDITAPYTPGALRGGSHVHVYSPNGQFVSFTYNDHVLHERDPALDLRNVGVAAPYGPVTPRGSIRANTAAATGACWSAARRRLPRRAAMRLIAPMKRAGSGTMRWRLLAIRWRKMATKCRSCLLSSCRRMKPAGSSLAAPLAGTATTMPAPPAGVSQRRLTFTHHRRYPGLVNVPRHWVRANPQATAIAFLMRDDAGVVQLWLISPQGASRGS
jgi:hypothetical protein